MADPSTDCSTLVSRRRRHRGVFFGRGGGIFCPEPVTISQYRICCGIYHIVFFCRHEFGEFFGYWSCVGAVSWPYFVASWAVAI